MKEPIPTKRVIRKAGKGLRIGYRRVSAVDQNEFRQLEGWELNRSTSQFGRSLHFGALCIGAATSVSVRKSVWFDLDKTFTDTASGKDTKRPNLELLLSFIREGDTLVCHSMDRLARNLDDLRKMVLDLTKRGVHVQFVKESLTFTGEDSPMANLLLNVMGAFAHNAEPAIMRSHAAVRPEWLACHCCGASH